MQEWRDEAFMQSEDYLILPAKNLGLRGLHLFGHAEFGAAYPGLVEHIHPGCIEITAMMRGSQMYTVEGEEYHLYSGDVYATFLDEAHSTGMHPQEVSEIIWLQLDLREKSNFLGLASPWDEKFYERLCRWKRQIVKMEQGEMELLRRAFRCFAMARPDDFEKRSYGQSLLTAFLNGIMEKEQAQVEVTPDIQMSVAFIQRHLTEQIEIEDLAQMAGLSLAWFKSKFREQMGLPPREYINRRRIELAKEYIKSGRTSVTTVAYELGFASSSYFASVFRQFVGTSPKEYQQYCRREEIRRTAV